VTVWVSLLVMFSIR